jgi:hypothetical protein
MDAATLARHLAALPAAAMRRAVLGEALGRLAPDAAAQLCGELVRRGREGASFDVALATLGAVLDGGDLGYQAHGALYAAARARADEAFARLLLSAQPPPPGAPPALVDHHRRPASEGPGAPPGKPNVTLGERKSLARGRRRDVLDRLLRDPDESVLRILLGNPRLTESDVIGLAARRPTSAAAQRAIFRSERFSCRHGVRRALVLNPFTPSDLATRLVGLLPNPDLRVVAADATLAEPVRRAARDLLARVGR